MLAMLHSMPVPVQGICARSCNPSSALQLAQPTARGGGSAASTFASFSLRRTESSQLGAVPDADSAVDSCCRSEAVDDAAVFTIRFKLPVA